MHRGVRDFIAWVDAHRTGPHVQLNPPASTADLAALEQMLGGPLPVDLKMVLTRFNGGILPAGTLLPAGIGPGTIGSTVREYAEAIGEDFLDPELLLPFHRTLEGSLLAFDRSAGPMSDTWPIVDYFQDLDEHRLMYRTFDGWCAFCVAEWESDDFAVEFSLETYLRSGRRHVAVEPDVATAHATVAHALKRAGHPRESLGAYLCAARCIPPLHWCDWEALKLACILRHAGAALEAARRLASHAPALRWSQRETEPGRVAEALGRLGGGVLDRDREKWLRVLEQLLEQAKDGEVDVVYNIREALMHHRPLPAPRPHRAQCAVPPLREVEAWWRHAEEAYRTGQLRDEDLLFDAQLHLLERHRPLADLLRIRRDF